MVFGFVASVAVAECPSTSEQGSGPQPPRDIASVEKTHPPVDLESTISRRKYRMYLPNYNQTIVSRIKHIVESREHFATESRLGISVCYTHKHYCLNCSPLFVISCYYYTRLAYRTSELHSRF